MVYHIPEIIFILQPAGRGQEMLEMKILWSNRAGVCVYFSVSQWLD